MEIGLFANLEEEPDIIFIRTEVWKKLHDILVERQAAYWTTVFVSTDRRLRPWLAISVPAFLSA